MSQESRSDLLPTASWRTHRGDECQVNQLAEAQILAIIPPRLVEPLPEEFDRWLSAVLLSLGHVQVVHINVELLARSRTKHAFSSFVHLRVEKVLCHVRTGIRRERHSDGDHIRPNDFAVHLSSSHQILIDIDCFPRSCSSHHQDMLVIGEQQIQQIRVTHRVVGGYDNLGEGKLGVDLELVDDIHPLDPLLCLNQKHEIVHHSSLWKRPRKLVAVQLFV
mmetsp:Transcript_7017/g.9948  ORF Transcript_7017/g.9948 Transcript_7017/m.9948 type:complete len:220 (-) Transcript_7017:2615-3274(-)